MVKKTLVRDQDKFMLRLPDGLREDIRAAAEANGRSMNAEIIARLHHSPNERRERIATAALAGILACYREFSGAICPAGLIVGRARVAVSHADALIAELDAVKP